MQVMELGLDSLDLSYGRLRVADRRREAQLMASMEEQGQQDAISVVAADDGRWLVVDGHKRVRALRRLRRDVVKAVVLAMSPAEALAAAYRADSGPGRSAIEEGWLVYELHRVGKWDLGKTAAAIGRSKSWASRRLGLVEGLPDAVLEGVRSGKLGAWSAMKHLLPLARANAAACERLAGQDRGSEPEQPADSAGVRAFRQERRAGEGAHPGGPGTISQGVGGVEQWARGSRAQRGREPGSQADGTCGQRGAGADARPAASAGLRCRGSCPRQALVGVGARRKRLALLDETVAALKAAQGKKREERHAQSGNTDGRLDPAQAGTRQPQDSERLEDRAQRGAGGDCQRPSGGPPRQGPPHRLEPFVESLRQLHAECRGNLVRVWEELDARQGVSVPYTTLTRFCRERGIGVLEKTPAGRIVTGSR